MTTHVGPADRDQPSATVAVPSRLGPDLTAVAALDAVFVAAFLWWQSGGLDALAVPEAVIGSVGRLVGLVAANLLLMQVLLMARIPWLERYLGLDQLVRLHRRLGATSVCLVVTHVVLIVISRVEPDDSSALGRFWALATESPVMVLAFVAVSLLVLVALTSIRGVRRRVPYQRWHLLHLYAYLGVGLALPHQLLVGTAFAGSTLATAYWWTLYLLTALGVLTFRVARPIVTSLRCRIVVDEVVPEGAGVVSVHLSGRDLDRLPVRPGQFFFWRFLGGWEGLRANPFSLSAGPLPGRLRITVRGIGDGSRRIAALAPGTKVFVEGPFGAITGARRTGRPLLLVAAGIGITPLRALLDELDDVDLRTTTLLYRVSGRDEVIFATELEAFAARGMRLQYLQGPRAESGWLPAGIAASDIDLLDALVPDIVDHDAFLCGPPVWMALVRDSMQRAGVPDERIHAEEFGW